MTVEQVETLVIGGGQAGVALSGHLVEQGLPHLVVERHRIAERWRTERWDSLVANGPSWHDRFPGMAFPGVDPDAFATKDQIVTSLCDYAAQVGAPIRTGVTVTALTRTSDGHFRAETSDGVIEARQVVAATGPFQRPIIPPLLPESAGLTQLHSAHYRNPDALPEGAVLVIGAGSSGTQIADELLASGRRVFLAVGPHHRPPRRYRGRDFVWWLGALGKWDAPANDPGLEHVTIAVSGANGGHTIDFRNLAARGMTLLGRAERYADGRITFAADLAANIAGGDADYLSVLREGDAYVEREGLDLPPEPEAHLIGPMPADALDPILSLDLTDEGITSVIWATGYALDFGWLQVDGAFDPDGRPRHDKGISAVPGLYFLGLSWLSRRASPFIWGVWHDAARIAHHIKERAKASEDLLNTADS